MPIGKPQLNDKKRWSVQIEDAFQDALRRYGHNWRASDYLAALLSGLDGKQNLPLTKSEEAFAERMDAPIGSVFETAEEAQDHLRSLGNP